MIRYNKQLNEFKKSTKFNFTVIDNSVYVNEMKIVPVKIHGRMITQKHLDILRDYLQNISVKVLASKYDVTNQRIYQIIRETQRKCKEQYYYRTQCL